MKSSVEGVIVGHTVTFVVLTAAVLTTTVLTGVAKVALVVLAVVLEVALAPGPKTSRLVYVVDEEAVDELVDECVAVVNGVDVAVVVLRQCWGRAFVWLFINGL